MECYFYYKFVHHYDSLSPERRTTVRPLIKSCNEPDFGQHCQYSGGSGTVLVGHRLWVELLLVAMMHGELEDRFSAEDYPDEPNKLQDVTDACVVWFFERWMNVDVELPSDFDDNSPSSEADTSTVRESVN